MAYTERDFRSKKELKEAVSKWVDYQELLKNKPWPGTIGAIVAQPALMRPPQPVRTYQPGPFAANHPSNGTVYLEGPHYPKAHTWYAQAELKDGIVIKVK